MRPLRAHRGCIDIDAHLDSFLSMLVRLAPNAEVAPPAFASEGFLEVRSNPFTPSKLR
jgi:hypothetical protein